MTQEEIKQIEQIIDERLQNILKIDRYVFDKHIQVLDGRNIQVGRTTGTKIATEGGTTGQKLGFWNTTPKVQPAKINDSAGDDATAVNAILDLLESLGLMRSS